MSPRRLFQRPPPSAINPGSKKRGRVLNATGYSTYSRGDHHRQRSVQPSLLSKISHRTGTSGARTPNDTCSMLRTMIRSAKKRKKVKRTQGRTTQTDRQGVSRSLCKRQVAWSKTYILQNTRRQNRCDETRRCARSTGTSKPRGIVYHPTCF